MHKGTALAAVLVMVLAVATVSIMAMDESDADDNPIDSVLYDVEENCFVILMKQPVAGQFSGIVYGPDNKWVAMAQGMVISSPVDAILLDVTSGKEIVEGTYTVTLIDGTASWNATAWVAFVESLSLDKTTLRLTVGSTDTLKVSITPSDACLRDVTWSSSDESVASVDSYGKVTAKSAGSATITVTAADETKGTKTATCSLTVVNDTPTPTPTPTPTKYAVTVTTDGHGTATASPSSASSGTKVTLTATPNQGYAFKEWQSSDVTISGSTFTMPSKNVSVKAVFEESSTTVPVTGITISDSELKLKAGGTVTLTASVVPSNATNRSVSWSSSDSSIVSVSDGKLTAKAAGTAVVTVTSQDGGFTATCTVTVIPADYIVPAEGGQVDESELEKAIESVKENPGQAVVVVANSDSVTIPAGSLKEILDQGSEVTVSLSNGDVTIPEGAVSGLTSSDRLKLVVEQTDTPSGFVLPDGAVVVDVSMFLGDSKVTSFGTPITVSIPVSLSSGQDASKLKVFYLADDGSVTDMNASFDADEGAMVFTTDHLSVYAVAESVKASGNDSGSGSSMWLIIVIIIVIVIIAAVVLRKRL